MIHLVLYPIKLAGFKTAKEVWQKGTVIIVAEK